MIVIITSCVAYQWTVGTAPFKLSGRVRDKESLKSLNFAGISNVASPNFAGNVEPGIPTFSLPPFQFEHNNQTIGFIQICTELGSGIVVVPLVAVLANVAIAKAFSESKML